ncbi:MAG: phosphoribosylamine--glycine ligase [Chlorobi bacterium]|nr:phosphoribosylamine--glycine ligase [Chlorobiota bacterium]
MNILVLGSGGREHAISWKLSQSPECDNLFIAPGNAGTTELGTNVPVNPNDFNAIEKLIMAEDIDMVVIGPEEPLVRGIYEHLRAVNSFSDLMIIGPTQRGAMLEGSKVWAKDFMQKNNIPTARYGKFSAGQTDKAKKFLKTLNPPYVLKADGLAAGKGVLILKDINEAVFALGEMFGGKFGDAGKNVVIEEFLDGIEVSVFILTDGSSYVLFPEAKDYKRIGEGDTGLNTGGMGAVSPVPFATPEFIEKVEDRIIIPTLQGLYNGDIGYCGFLYFGLMNVNGDPYVVEYNVRLGDPEAEVVLPRVESDFAALLAAAARGTLSKESMTVNPSTVVTVMLVSGGYPQVYQKGKEITVEQITGDALLFHAGTITDGKKVVTNGGRVLAVSAYGKDMNDALKKAYRQAEHIAFDRKYYRKDIGFDLA